MICSYVSVELANSLHLLPPAAPPPASVPDDQPAEEDTFELPTLEEVARLTGTLRPQPLGRPVEICVSLQHVGSRPL